jgi:DNA-binding Lrp family transcriptional regulator
MNDSVKLDETDLKIVAALQANPRASWSRISGALGIDALTVQRRWTRLESAGAGWLGCYAPFETGLVAAYVAIQCRPGRSIFVANAIAQIPQAMTVNIEAGTRDILVEVVMRSPRELADLVLQRLGEIEGIRSIQTMPIIRIYADASQWRAHQLPAPALEILATEAPEITQLSASRPLSEHARMVASALATNPRIPVVELAAHLGTSTATARHRLDELLSRHRMLRCDIARSLSPWPVRATFMAEVPVDQLDESAKQLVRLPETRSVISVAGIANLVIAVWLPSQEHVQHFELSVARALPQLQIVDRSIEIRSVKISGELLDSDGLSIGRIPVSL